MLCLQSAGSEKGFGGKVGPMTVARQILAAGGLPSFFRGMVREVAYQCQTAGTAINCREFMILF